MLWIQVTVRQEVEEAAAAAESLQNQAGNLSQVVSMFQLDGTCAADVATPAISVF